MTTPRELIQRVRELSEAATPGRWIVETIPSAAFESGYITGQILTENGGYVVGDTPIGVGVQRQVDAALIAEFRTAAPLLARINAVLLDALKEIERDMALASVAERIAHVALLKAEEMCRED